MLEHDVDIDMLFESDQEDALKTYLRLLHHTDVAELFNFVDQANWQQIVAHLTPEQLGMVLADLDERQRELLGEVLTTETLVEVVEELESDDAADVLADLPEEKTDVVLTRLADEELEALLAYPDDCAGGIMQTEVCRVGEDKHVEDAIEAVRRSRDDVDDIFKVYVVDSRNRLQGTVKLEDLVLAEPGTLLRDIRHPVEVQINAKLDQEEVAKIFRKYDLPVVPVVDDRGKLLGRITFDDVHDVLEEEHSEDLLTIAGASSQELVYEGAFLRIAMFRLPWLLVSLVGVLISSQLVPLFSVIRTDALILAAFVPVCGAVTGNLGSQCAMIITRGFAIGKVDFSNLRRVLGREMIVGLVMGIAAGSIVGLFGYVRHGDASLGFTLGLSVICSMTASTVLGVVAPAAFKRVGIDPALAAGPFVTTTCDLLSITTYLFVAFLTLKG